MNNTITETKYKEINQACTFINDYIKEFPTLDLILGTGYGAVDGIVYLGNPDIAEEPYYWVGDGSVIEDFTGTNLNYLTYIDEEIDEANFNKDDYIVFLRATYREYTVRHLIKKDSINTYEGRKVIVDWLIYAVNDLYTLYGDESSLIDESFIKNYEYDKEGKEEMNNTKEKEETQELPEKVIKGLGDILKIDIYNSLLENLECTYLNLLNLKHSINNEEITEGVSIKYIDKDDLYDSLNTVSENILLLICNTVAVPNDKRVYRDLMLNNNCFTVLSDSRKEKFMEKMYSNYIIPREITFKDSFIKFTLTNDGEGNPLCNIKLDDEQELTITMQEFLSLKHIMNTHEEEINQYFEEEYDDEDKEL